MATQYARVTILSGDVRDARTGEVPYPLGTILTGRIAHESGGLIALATDAGATFTFREGEPAIQVELSETAYTPDT